MSRIIGAQAFHWSQYYYDLNKNYRENLDELFSTISGAGLNAWEDSTDSEEYAEQLGLLLRKHDLKLPSIYANSTLHTDEWEESISSVLQQAKWAKALGASIVVSNPNPISWSDPVDKTDEQLRTQAHALNVLTKELDSLGMTMAYHTHAPEMRQGAREFHHMLLATRESGMKFCLDFQWLHRGTGNSQVALEDLIELYGDRVVTTHIRQTNNGIWSESLNDGDIDYGRLVSKLNVLGYEGPLIIENAREEGTTIAPSMLAAYSDSKMWVDSTFLK